MNTIWLKIAGIALVVLVVIVVVGSLTSNDNAPANPPQTTEPPRTFNDMTERDKQFLEEPELVGEATSGQEAATAPPNDEQSQQLEATGRPQSTEPEAQPQVQPASPYIMPSSITEETMLYFKPMDEIDDIAAQELMPNATTGRSLGRLPFLHPNLMVQACRQAEERWPDSWYAFRAKQLLEEISERYASTYDITKQELDISRFMEPRPGTEARRVEPVQQ